MAVISSPLAKSLQGGLVQRVAGSTFGGGRGIIPVSSPDVGSQKNEALLETNQETLAAISSSLSSISAEIRSIRDGITSIGQRLAAESSMEQAAARADAEYQKRLAERQIRSSGEQELENKIQTALTTPVTRIQNKVSSVFGNVMSALNILFLGWLTNQGIDAIKAAAEGNIKKLKEIGGNVIKAFAFLIGARGAFSLLKAGIFRVISSIGSLAGRVSKFVISGLFVRPFQILINAIKNRWSGLRGGGGVPTPPPGVPGGPKGPAGPKGGKFGLMNVVGGLITGLSTGMNFLNGENIDAALGALSLIPGKGWIFKGIRGAAASVFTLDEIAEAFGGNLTGKKKEELKQQEEKTKQSNQTSPAQTAPVAQAQTPMMGDKSGEKGVTAKEPDAAEVKMPSSGAAVPAGMEGTAQTPTVTPQTPKTPDASSLSLGSSAPPATGMQGSQKPLSTSEKAEVTPASKSTAEVTPVPSQNANTKMESLGPESKKPTTVIAQVPSAPPSQAKPPTPSAGTNVPNIRSSNPDNFYALYSQFNYNVVI